MESHALESIVDELELSVQSADSRLDLMSMRLDTFEREFFRDQLFKDLPSDAVADGNKEPNGEEAAVGNEDEDNGLEPKLVRELLTEVTRVKEEYKQLHHELRQVQELQQEVTQSLRNQMIQVQCHFNNLRNRIIGSGSSGGAASQN